MEQILLRDPAFYPDSPILEMALGDQYPAYQKFADAALGKGLAMEWNYDKDGKN
jgi:hypothetical protein